MNIFLQWLVSALAVLITAYLLPGVTLSGFGAALIVAVILGVLNIFIRPILLILTLPINILTLGLFTFVVNALIIMLASGVSPGFYVVNFWWALIFSVVLSLVNSLFDRMVAKDPN
ncbi:MAG: phage holin family protein [Patescibacteria group bacterium]